MVRFKSSVHRFGSLEVAARSFWSRKLAGSTRFVFGAARVSLADLFSRLTNPGVWRSIACRIFDWYVGGSSARASSISTDELLCAGVVVFGVVVFGVVVFGVGALVGSGADCVVASAVAFPELDGNSVVLEFCFGVPFSGRLDFSVLPVFSVAAIFSEESD